jgi:hypothetical protein
VYDPLWWQLNKYLDARNTISQSWDFRHLELICFVSLVMQKLQYIMLTHEYIKKFSVVKQLTAIPFILAPWTVLNPITHMASSHAAFLSTVDHACNGTSTMFMPQQLIIRDQEWKWNTYTTYL